MMKLVFNEIEILNIVIVQILLTVLSYILNCLVLHILNCQLISNVWYQGWQKLKKVVAAEAPPVLIFHNWDFWVRFARFCTYLVC